MRRVDIMGAAGKHTCTSVATVMLIVALVACGRSAPAPGPPGPTPSSTAATPTAPPSPTPTTPTPTAPATTPTKPPAPTTSASVAPFPRALLGKDVERIPTTSKVVALTFDAGANADGVASILATLSQQQAKATFFLTGAFVAAFPDQCRSIAAAGHRIGDHSVDHPYFTDLTDAQIRAEVLNAATTIRNATGASPAPLFRFPYGDRDARTIAAVNAAGYLPVRWTVDSLGWQGTMNATRDASFVVQRVVAATSPGAIVAMHVGSNPDDHSTLDAAALPAIIAQLRAAGYTFVTLDALLT